MIPALFALIGTGIALPHVLRLERSSPAAAVALWAASLALRALMVVFVVLYLMFFLPSTQVFATLTHWCWHTVLPLLTAHLGLDGHRVGDAATILPGLVAIVSLLSVTFGVIKGAHTVRRLLARNSLGPGPSNSVIVGGQKVILVAAGITRPQVVVSAGALIELDDEELAAGLDHEHGHIARRHRFLLVFAELCRSVGRIVPGCRRALRELGFHLERDADRWALRRSHSRYALASAICKAAGASSASSSLASALSGGGARERLDELIDDAPTQRSGPAVWLLNTVAVTMVGVTLLVAALIPSSALAGAHEVGDAHQIHHCEH